MSQTSFSKIAFCLLTFKNEVSKCEIRFISSNEAKFAVYLYVKSSCIFANLTSFGTLIGFQAVLLVYVVICFVVTVILLLCGNKIKLIRFPTLVSKTCDCFSVNASLITDASTLDKKRLNVASYLRILQVFPR